MLRLFLTGFKATSTRSALTTAPPYLKMEPEVMAVETLTQGLKQKPDTLRQLNPAVYDAAQNTMRFAALFRFVKQRNPESWNEFMAQVLHAEVSPAVKTPTQWPKKK